MVGVIWVFVTAMRYLSAQVGRVVFETVPELRFLTAMCIVGLAVLAAVRQERAFNLFGATVLVTYLVISGLGTLAGEFSVVFFGAGIIGGFWYGTIRVFREDVMLTRRTER